MMPPAPPPPYGWVETYQTNLKPAELPEQAMRGATSLTGSAILNMNIWQKPDGTFAKPDCRTIRSSGNSEIDKASCALLESASYSFAVPSRHYGSMQVRVHWKKGRAKIDYPARDRITPLKFSVEPSFAAPAGLSFSEDGGFAFTFGPGGRVDCQVLYSTGSDALDVAACRNGAAHARFTPEINLFGEEVSRDIVYWLSASDGQLRRPR